MFDFGSWTLPNTPSNVIEIMKTQASFVTIRKEFYDIRCIPITSIRFPCVVCSLIDDRNCNLLLPCSSMAEFC